MRFQDILIPIYEEAIKFAESQSESDGSVLIKYLENIKLHRGLCEAMKLHCPNISFKELLKYYPHGENRNPYMGWWWKTPFNENYNERPYKEVIECLIIRLEFLKTIK